MQMSRRFGTNTCYECAFFSSNGLLDPWSSGGVLKTVSKTNSVVSYVIPEGAHHLDLRARNQNDPASVETVRSVK